MSSLFTLKMKMILIVQMLKVLQRIRMTLLQNQIMEVQNLIMNQKPILKLPMKIPLPKVLLIVLAVLVVQILTAIMESAP